MFRSWVKVIAGVVVGLALIHAEAHSQTVNLYPILWAILAGMALFGIGIYVAYRRIMGPGMVWDEDEGENNAYDPAYHEDEANTPGLERHFRPAGTATPAMPGMWRSGARLVGGLVASDVAYFAGKALACGARLHTRGARIARFFFDGIRPGNTHPAAPISGHDRDDTGGHGQHDPRPT